MNSLIRTLKNRLSKLIGIEFLGPSTSLVREVWAHGIAWWSDAWLWERASLEASLNISVCFPTDLTSSLALLRNQTFMCAFAMRLSGLPSHEVRTLMKGIVFMETEHNKFNLSKFRYQHQMGLVRDLISPMLLSTATAFQSYRHMSSNAICQAVPFGQAAPRANDVSDGQL